MVRLATPARRDVISSAGGGAGGPLILTALLPPELQARMNALRREHFPPERNHLPAHVTLFHAFPPSCEAELRQVMAQIAGANPPPRGRLAGLMPLGGGTAIALSSPALLAIRDDVADRFHALLSPQDRGRPRLHVTIQNKVSAGEARRLQMKLSQEMHPLDFAFTGLALNAYQGGPWHDLKSRSFRG